jgi:high-affinity nickel-transport protein
MRANLRGPVAAMFMLLVGANLAAWAWAFMAFRHAPALLGTSLLAYGLGLRHAVDADHIAAIDNVTRKLIQDGQRPIATGLFFSLGHSTVVFFVSIAAGFTASRFGTGFADLKTVGGIVGTAVSGSFLLLIAVTNLRVLISANRAFRRGEQDPEGLPPAPGLIARMLGWLFRLITRSWQMYPLGFLFGLGFDTATEVALLSISAIEISKGLSLSAALVFPVLFAAGMSFVDAADGVFMAGAYAWAYVKPARKLFYNMAVTAFSAGVAFLVGGAELSGLIGSRLDLGGKFWQAMAWLNGNFLDLGFFIIAVFAIVWIASAAIHRLGDPHRIEPRDFN